MPDQRKKRRCLKCRKMFDSLGPGNQRCGTCKSKDGRPPTIQDYGQARSSNSVKSAGRPKKWR